MSQTSSEVTVFKPTNELVRILGRPALVGAEKIEDYESFFNSVASAMKPPDIIGWLFAKDVTDWSWDIQRERTVRAELIKYHELRIIGELLKSELAPEGQADAASYRVFFAADEVDSCRSDPGFRAEREKELAAKGFDGAYILTQAYIRCAGQIDTIDKRIAFQEQRRSAALKENGLWSEQLLRRLNQAIPEVIDGEFTDTEGE